MARINKGSIDRAQAAERRALKAQANDRKVADAYINFVQAVGVGANNALSSSTYGFNPITRIRTLVEWIYRGSWFGGVAVDIVAEDMTRAGIEIHSIMPPEDVEKVQQTLVRTGIWGGVTDTIKWSRLYGGCLGVILIDGHDPSTPLDVDRIPRGGFKGLLPLDRWTLEPDLNDLVTEFGAELGNPKFYRVTSDAPAFKGKRVHYSRCMRLTGVKLPYWQSIMENLWGISIYERLYDRMVSFDSATMGMAQNVFRSYIRTYKLKNFTKIMSEGSQQAKAGLFARMAMMRQTQGNEGITLIDAEDEFTAASNSTFTGIGEAVLHIAEQLSGALQIPLTRMFGQSPGGMNSTGESDLRTYYDGIAQKQESELREPMTKIIRCICRSEGIKIPDNFGFGFNKLWQLTEDQKSQVFARDAEAISALEMDGLISMQVALKELRQLSRVTGRMSNITDDDIDKADDEVPPKPVVGELGPDGLPKPPMDPSNTKEKGMEPREPHVEDTGRSLRSVA